MKIHQCLSASRRIAGVKPKAVGTPLCGLILFGAIGSISWLDLVYRIGIEIGIPEMLNMR
jgi:hypothetical protein